MAKREFLHGRASSRKGASQVEKALDALASTSGLRLTLYDFSAFFIDPANGESLVPGQWMTHTCFPVCSEAYRVDKPACVAHCRKKANAKAARAGRPVFHECRMGIVEIAVPFFVRGRFIGSLFAGQWRRSGKRGPESLRALSAAAREDYARLDEFAASKLERLAETLYVFCKGLSLCVEETPGSKPLVPSIASAALDYAKDCVARKASVSGLARKLGISKTRACHLVKELFGVSFGELLWHEKMKLARSLLTDSDGLRIAEVARCVGIESEFHFNRRFKRTQGVSPGEYRRRNFAGDAKLSN